METIAGVDPKAVMRALRVSRQIFHSEADFQHAFAWTVHQLDHSVQIRLEVRHAIRNSAFMKVGLWPVPYGGRTGTTRRTSDTLPEATSSPGSPTSYFPARTVSSGGLRSTSMRIATRAR